MEGLAGEAFETISMQRGLDACYASISNLAWYGVQPLEIGLDDITRPVEAEDGIWFGPYREQLHITASGNLLYNLACIAREGEGCILTLKLDCTYEGLRFIPLTPCVEASTMLVWKKAQAFSPAAKAFISFIEHSKTESQVGSF